MFTSYTSGLKATSLLATAAFAFLGSMQRSDAVITVAWDFDPFSTPTVTATITGSIDLVGMGPLSGLPILLDSPISVGTGSSYNTSNFSLPIPVGSGITYDHYALPANSVTLSELGLAGGGVNGTVISGDPTEFFGYASSPGPDAFTVPGDTVNNGIFTLTTPVVIGFGGVQLPGEVRTLADIGIGYLDTGAKTVFSNPFATGDAGDIRFVSVNAVPEPSTGLLAGLAGCALLLRRRRQA